MAGVSVFSEKFGKFGEILKTSCHLVLASFVSFSSQSNHREPQQIYLVDNLLRTLQKTNHSERSGPLQHSDMLRTPDFPKFAPTIAETKIVKKWEIFRKTIGFDLCTHLRQFWVPDWNRQTLEKSGVQDAFECCKGPERSRANALEQTPLFRRSTSWSIGGHCEKYSGNFSETCQEYLHLHGLDLSALRFHMCLPVSMGRRL